MKNTLLVFIFILTSCNEKVREERKNTVFRLQSQTIVADVPVCPENMNHIKGDYCLEYEPKCQEWMDPPSTKERFRRCLTYEEGTCESKTEALNFCIDTYEHSEAESDLPITNVNWREASAMCESEGKRLCSNEEWTLSCEGPELNVHPYGNTRDQNTCYHDKVLKEMISNEGELLDLRKDVFTHPECVSSFGVRNMTGNVGEWVTEKAEPPNRSGGKGGWWNSGLRSRCRPTTYGHDELFKQVQIGFRCCKDIKETNEK